MERGLSTDNAFKGVSNFTLWREMSVEILAHFYFLPYVRQEDRSKNLPLQRLMLMFQCVQPEKDKVAALDGASLCVACFDDYLKLWNTCKG